MSVGARAAHLFKESESPYSRWYCGVPDCDGSPHEGSHWCEHPIDGEHDWTCRHARSQQCPPPTFVSGEARNWLIIAGRGFGKTRAAAEWLADQARRNPGTNWAVVAPTNDDLADTCFEGESGLLQALQIDREDDAYNKSRLLVRLPNGSTIRSYSAEVPRKARGPNLSGVWLEEIAQWRDRSMWDNLFPAVRRGLAQVVVTTTPAPVPILLEFTNREDGSVVMTGGSTYENAANLSPAALAELQIRWKGTRRERQELFGELLEDVPGALWQAQTIETTRAVLID